MLGGAGGLDGQRCACVCVPAGSRKIVATQSVGRRNDAGLAAAEVALAVERAALGTGAIDTVGTTGVFDIKPGAVNSVPREAKLGIGERERARAAGLAWRGDGAEATSAWL